jgi:splicing factor U2AF subunit
MAQHLARIHGTEEDKVNCPFYFKIGACRHSDRCSRLHHRPAFSPTLLVKHLYRHPVRLQELQQAAGNVGNNTNNGGNNGGGFDEQQAQQDFLEFYEDLYTEFGKFGPIQELHIVDNLGDHMIGHVYVKYEQEEDAADAVGIMNGRYYDGVAMAVEFSPVTEFREARCRDYDEGSCSRAGFCNFIHAKPVPPPLIRSLQEDVEVDRRREQDERRRAAKDERHSRHGKKRSRRDKSSSSSHHRSSSSRHRGDHAEEDTGGGGGGGHDDDDSDSDDRDYSPDPASTSEKRSSRDGDDRNPKKTRRIKTVDDA